MSEPNCKKPEAPKRRVCVMHYMMHWLGDRSLRFSEESAKALEAGEVLVKKSGDCKGDFEIQVRMVRR